MPLAVSTARTDITPQPGHPMGGYGATGAARTATGTYSPLTARAVVLWDDGWPNVVVSADLLGIPATVNAQVRAALTELADPDLVLLASHTHNGPALGGVLDPYIAYGIADPTPLYAYADWLAQQLVDVVRAALAAPQTPVTLDYQVASQGFARNRAGLSYTESAVPVLTARDGTGQPRAVLFSYGCHPVSAGNQTRWDGDYPAAAAAVVEAAIPGCTALFVPGPAGDQDPVGTRGWRLRDRLGAQLGSAVVTAASSTGRTLTGPVRSSYDVAELPLDVATTAANLAAVRSAYVARQANSGLHPWYRRHAERMIAQIDASTYDDTVTVPTQVWKLAGSTPLRLAFVGGELVSGYAVYFRGRYGGTGGLVIGGYANECACYLPSNELLPPVKSGASYEGGWDGDYPGIAGGSMTVYARIGHFRAGSTGIESALIAQLTSQLA